jgi:hypothetical protein
VVLRSHCVLLTNKSPGVRKSNGRSEKTLENANRKREQPTEKPVGAAGGKALKGKSHGRDRSETWPGDGGRMKALRAWETPGRHRNSAVGNRWEYVAGHHRKYAEGRETAREAAVPYL